MLAIAVCAIVEAVIMRGKIRARIAAAREKPPIDRETGLLPRSSFEPRAGTEITRAKRFSTIVSVELIAILSGDPAAFGRLVAERLEFPEVGIRISNDAFCVISPGTPDGATLDVAALALESESVIAQGHAAFPEDSDDVAQLLNIATQRIGTA